MMNSLYAVFRKYCREHGEELILGAFDQFVFIYFIILLINCEKQHSGVLTLCFIHEPPADIFSYVDMWTTCSLFCLYHHLKGNVVGFYFTA